LELKRKNRLEDLGTEWNVKMYLEEIDCESAGSIQLDWWKMQRTVFVTDV
jgi:hypothetical protein